jgi:hypothetical protein
MYGIAAAAGAGACAQARGRRKGKHSSAIRKGVVYVAPSLLVYKYSGGAISLLPPEPVPRACCMLHPVCWCRDARPGCITISLRGKIGQSSFSVCAAGDKKGKKEDKGKKDKKDDKKGKKGGKGDEPPPPPERPPPLQVGDDGDDHDGGDDDDVDDVDHIIKR